MSMRLSSNRRNPRKGNNGISTTGRTEIVSESDSLPDIFGGGLDGDQDDVILLTTVEEKENLAEMIGSAVGQTGSKSLRLRQRKERAASIEDNNSDMNGSSSDIFEDSVAATDKQDEDLSNKKTRAGNPVRNVQKEAKIVSDYILLGKIAGPRKSQRIRMLVDEGEASGTNENEPGDAASSKTTSNVRVKSSGTESVEDKTDDAVKEDEEVENEEGERRGSRSTRNVKKINKGKDSEIVERGYKESSKDNKKLLHKEKLRTNITTVTAEIHKDAGPSKLEEKCQSKDKTATGGSDTIEEDKEGVREEGGASDGYGTPRKLRNQTVKEAQVSRQAEEAESDFNESCEQESTKEDGLERTASVEKEREEKEMKGKEGKEVDASVDEETWEGETPHEVDEMEVDAQVDPSDNPELISSESEGMEEEEPDDDRQDASEETISIDKKKEEDIENAFIGEEAKQELSKDVLVNVEDESSQEDVGLNKSSKTQTQSSGEEDKSIGEDEGSRRNQEREQRIEVDEDGSSQDEAGPRQDRKRGKKEADEDGSSQEEAGPRRDRKRGKQVKVDEDGSSQDEARPRRNQKKGKQEVDEDESSQEEAGPRRDRKRGKQLEVEEDGSSQEEARPRRNQKKGKQEVDEDGSSQEEAGPKRNRKRGKQVKVEEDGSSQEEAGPKWNRKRGKQVKIEEDGSSQEEAGPRKSVKKEKTCSDEDTEGSEDAEAEDGRRKSLNTRGTEVKQEEESQDASSEDSSVNDFTQDFKGIRCTSCYQQLNQYNRKSLCEHPTLGVLICRRCIEYYYEGDFTKDDEGSDEQCQWCGEGGNLICCDQCPSAFCKSCICRNLSRREWTKISLNETSEWHCYVCDKKPLSELIKCCRAVIKSAEKSKQLSNQKEIHSSRTARPIKKETVDPLSDLHLFLEGRLKGWSSFQRKLDNSKKLAAKSSRKQLAQAVLNIRSFRKYLKSFQDQFEQCLEEVMSSGELSAGDTATDSVAVTEGGSENEPSEAKREAETSGENTTAKKQSREQTARRMKTTPSRRGSGSGQELSQKDVKEEEDSSQSSIEAGNGGEEDSEGDEGLEVDDGKVAVKDVDGGRAARDSEEEQSMQEETTSKDVEVASDSQDVLSVANDGSSEERRDKSSKGKIVCEAISVLASGFEEDGEKGNEEAKEEEDDLSQEKGSDEEMEEGTEQKKSSKADRKKVRKEKMDGKAVEEKEAKVVDSSVGKENGNKEDEDEFERLLMEEMEEEEEEGKEKNGDKDEDPTAIKKAKRMGKGKQKEPQAKKDISKLYKKEEAQSKKYVENSDTSDTEVSLIDVDLADEISRKMKRNRKKNRGKGHAAPPSSSSDTDEEVEKMVQKAKKRKKQPSSEEESPVKGQGSKTKGDSNTKSSVGAKKKRRKNSSGSDIDDEIERLGDIQFSGSKGKSRKKGGKGKTSATKKGKGKSKKEENEESDSDDFEELPEVNYDTDPELLMSSQKKKEEVKLEDAEEELAEKRLREELENDGKENNHGNSSSDTEVDNDEKKDGKQSKGMGKESKGKGKKGTDKKREDSNWDGSAEEDNSNSDAKEGKDKKKTKVHRLLKSRLISSSSSSNSDQEWNHKKKKLSDVIDKSDDDKGKKRNSRRGKKSKNSDSDFTASESSDDSVGKKKRKTKKKGNDKSRGSRNTSQTSGDESSDIEFIKKITKRKRKKAGTQTETDKGSSDEFQAERKKLRSYQTNDNKKKKSRIKKACASNSDSEDKARQDQSDSGSDDNKAKGRKKIRKVMSKKKLAQETRNAAEEERERRKRVQKKRQELIAAEMDSPQKSSTLKEVFLDRDPETKEILLEVDKQLVRVLKPHQAKGIQFMWDCTFESLADADKPGSGCILAHCMGLGKTLQVIAYLHTVMGAKQTGVKTALVVAPLNTVLNWEAEFEKWQEDLENAIDVYELASVKDNRSRADVLKHWQKNGGVMVMGYTMYRNLVFSRFVKNKRQKETFAHTLVDPGPDVVICDEGHLLKNDATATAKAMNSIHTRRRICLTGTPLQNNLIEYHCMVQFVKPQLLGTRKEFSNRFVNPISNGQCADSSPYDVKLMKKRAHILHNLLSGSVQRKDYSALAPYLPPKHEFVVLIRLSPKQIELYQRYLDRYSGSDNLDGRTVSLFKDYQVLMNVWTHPRLLKLAAIRTEKRKMTDEIKLFIDDETEVDTSEEEEVVEQVRDSSSGDELMRAIREKHPEAGPSNPENNGTRAKKIRGSEDSDSSVEVIKTWNTRRTRGDEEDDVTELEPPPPKKQWFTDLVDDTEHLKIEISGKMILLFEILKLAAAVGEKVLLFSQSLLTLDLIEDILEDQALKNVATGTESRKIALASSEEIELEFERYDTWTKGVDYFRIDGSVEAQTRKAMADKFNQSDNVRGRLFLVSTRAGSLGINLVAASRVIIFDACWNPSHDIQSIFRVYRFGQMKAVFIYRFIAQGTMEERIYDRQVTKQSLAQRVVDEQQVKRHYTQTELNELYNFQPDRLDDPDKPERPTPILPKDFILAELLRQQQDWIVKYHEHDSLLENVVDESLTEEERKVAWSEYEAEKEGRMLQMANPDFNVMPGMNPGSAEEMYRAQQQRLLLQQQHLQQQHHLQQQQHHHQQQQQQRPVYNMMDNNSMHHINQGSYPPSYSALSQFLQLTKMKLQGQRQPAPPPQSSSSLSNNPVRMNPGAPPMLRDFRPSYNSQPTSMHDLIRDTLISNPGSIRNTVVHPVRSTQGAQASQAAQPPPGTASKPSTSNISKPPP
ncbi:uncharacterized protein [Apostichopus japonicus]|uniref:uncharacterized protein isoform X2 n=1 Tax=Stichopus japonicus TaxID=307972 RepID=UPI003AB4E784